MFFMSYQSPVGQLIIEASEKGITALRPGKCERENPSPILRQALQELKEYFAGERKKFDVPLDVEGTEFQKKTWKALTEIPYGESISYLDLAKSVASPKHCRAVAGANNRNKLPLFIPCHRVIGSDGSLVGFAWGLDVKSYLLENEGVLIQNK